ncbi:MAG: flagellar hook-length control protein FliK [Bacillus sp. (in: Bacteria)]|nr:flagellar hook-length control protein FliK [Bacillus sp. (in: firmicutes)]
MDVAQIHIKINQTTLASGGKPRSTTQSITPTNSFDQIFAIYNFLGQSPALDRHSASAIQNGIDKTESFQAEQPKVSEEDWLELESILASCFVVIQQGQQTQAISEQSLGSFFSAIEHQASPILSIPNETTSDAFLALGQWLQKVTGINQTSTEDPGQLMQKLAELIARIQSTTNQDLIEVPDSIGEKIQIILDESKTANKYNNRAPLNSSSQENGMLFDDTSDGSMAATQGLQKVEGHNQTSPLDPMSEVPGGIGDIIKTILDVVPPVLSVSKFVPEVSEWISISLNDTNNQSEGLQARFALNPKHLGYFEINLTSKEGQLSAQIVTDTSLAKKELEGQLPQLREALLQQGFLIKKIDILQQTPVSMDLYPANPSIPQTGSNSSKQQQNLNFTTVQGLSIYEGSSSDRIPVTKLEDLSGSNEWAVMVNQQQRGSDGWNVTKAGSSPQLLSASEFVPEVSEWIGGYLRSTNGQSGSTEARFSLFPEHLGHIEIKITSQQGQVSAQIMTDTSFAKDALEGQLNQLKQALQEHGILVKKLDIILQTPVSTDSNQANLSFSPGGSSSSRDRANTSDKDESKGQKKDDQQKIGMENIPISYGGTAQMSVSSIDFSA